MTILNFPYTEIDKGQAAAIVAGPVVTQWTNTIVAQIHARLVEHYVRDPETSVETVEKWAVLAARYGRLALAEQDAE
jgi:hypothetical protein